ncbi:MAG: hypothetical protein ACXVQ7_02435 [Actinomycetota bacterium]
MSAAWVAGSVRARALSRRRLGRGGARALAQSSSLDEALASLARSPYGRDVRRGMSLVAAQHAVTTSTVWHLRVLAGWLPPNGARMLGALVAWFEIENVKDRVARLTGQTGEGDFDLGRLATAWTRLSAAHSMTELRAVLSASAWGDPGSDTPADLYTSMLLSWSRRVVGLVPGAARWADARAALIVARERFVSHREPSEPSHEQLRTLLGSRWVDAQSLVALRDGLPREAAWILEGIDHPDDLWKAEARWWTQLDVDGARMLARARNDPEVVVGAVGLLLSDGWRVRGALEMAARGGGPMEVFDVVA